MRNGRFCPAREIKGLEEKAREDINSGRGNGELLHQLARWFEWSVENDATAIGLYREAQAQGYDDAADDIIFVNAMRRDGKRVVDKDALDQVIQRYEAKAEAGDVDAQCRLGRYYDSSYYNAKGSRGKALGCYKLAAAKGHARAQYELAYSFCAMGGERDMGRAVELYDKAAARGHIMARYRLAKCHEEGDGVDKNLVKALVCYQELVNEGYDEAKAGVERVAYTIKTEEKAKKVGVPPSRSAVHTPQDRGGSFVSRVVRQDVAVGKPKGGYEGKGEGQGEEGRNDLGEDEGWVVVTTPPSSRGQGPGR